MWNIQSVEECLSTQDLVRQQLRNPLKDNLFPCIRTGLQTQGQGRRGRVWDSQNGDLAFSFAIKPACSQQYWASLSLVVGLAMVQTIGQDNLVLKWPNDILEDGQKVCGILCDVHNDFMIIGVGANLVPISHSQRSHVKTDKNADQVMRAFLQEFEGLLQEWNDSGFAVLKERWLKWALPQGSDISVKMGDEQVFGRFEGVDDNGCLLFMDENSRIKTVSSGELIT